eukprot:1161186-Pelagomonas_calceolata.AAC.13
MRCTLFNIHHNLGVFLAYLIAARLCHKLLDVLALILFTVQRVVGCHKALQSLWCYLHLHGCKGKARYICLPIQNRELCRDL